jgi:sugar phosphate isomerase/epimerase
MDRTDHLGAELHRRSLLRRGAAALTALALGPSALRATAQDKAPAGQDPPPDKSKPTKFLIACMTLPYSPFPFERALTGLKSVGYHHVALGHTHQRVPVMPENAPPDQAKEVGKKCRDLGLEPVMMFSVTSPDTVEPMKHRILQASAAGIGQLLTFGSTRGNDPKVWVKNLKVLGPIARDHGVLIVAKQHGGNTGTGAGLAEIVREVADEGVKVNYDAGNVMDYYHGKVNALDDIRTCASEVRSFCIKDHRFFPKDQDCGAGLGEIDHYRLLAPVAFTGRTIPLCSENISAPNLRASTPEDLDALAKRAREFLELVIKGLQA